VRTGEEIRACAETTLDKYADVPVRSFVLTLAEREARDCLRADRCSPSPRNAITTPGKAGRRVSFAASTASNHGGPECRARAGQCCLSGEQTAKCWGRFWGDPLVVRKRVNHAVSGYIG
jgi:hypothetical protein